MGSEVDVPAPPRPSGHAQTWEKRQGDLQSRGGGILWAFVRGESRLGIRGASGGALGCCPSPMHTLGRELQVAVCTARVTASPPHRGADCYQTDLGVWVCCAPS